MSSLRPYAEDEYSMSSSELKNPLKMLTVSELREQREFLRWIGQSWVECELLHIQLLVDDSRGGWTL
jgi:hypothetical protein